jgi:hypothetical protein
MVFILNISIKFSKVNKNMQEQMESKREQENRGRAVLIGSCETHKMLTWRPCSQPCGMPFAVGGKKEKNVLSLS